MFFSIMVKMVVMVAVDILVLTKFRNFPLYLHSLN